MKKFVAIGHWDSSKNITSVAGDSRDRKAFADDLKNNGFVAYMIFSEKKISEYKEADIFGKMDMISSRNRHAIDIEDYLNECMDIIEDKLAAI